MLSDLALWQRANELREAVLEQIARMANGKVYSNWRDHPVIKKFCDPNAELDTLGFKIVEIGKEHWSQWEAKDDRFESEVVIIIAAPDTKYSEIHYHEGNVWLTGLGEQYGFTHPAGFLLRGRLDTDAILSGNAKTELRPDVINDGSVFPVQSLVPHGFYVPKGGLTVMVAVTCGKRFNNDGDINAVVIDPEEVMVYNIHAYPLEALDNYFR